MHLDLHAITYITCIWLFTCVYKFTLFIIIYISFPCIYCAMGKHFLFSWKYILHSCIAVYWVFVTPLSWPFGIFGPVRSARSTYRQRTAARRHGRFQLDLEMCFNRFRLQKVWQTWGTLSNFKPWIPPPNSTLCQAFRWRQPSYNALLEAIRLHCRCGRAGRAWRFVKNPGSFSIVMSDCDDGKKHEQQLDNHQFFYGWIC